MADGRRDGADSGREGGLAMTKGFRLPTTLYDIGLISAEGYSYISAVKEFIDHLIRDLKAKGVYSDDAILPISVDAFREQPPHLPVAWQCAYLAGLAEYLAVLSGQRPPEWSERAEYFLA